MSNATPTWLDRLLNKLIAVGGVQQPSRGTIDFASGFTVTDDPGNDTTHLTVSAASGGGQFNTTISNGANHDVPTNQQGLIVLGGNTAAASIDGFVAPAGAVGGERRVIVNSTAFPITLNNLGTGSTSGNRIAIPFGVDVVLAPRSGAWAVVYDATTSPHRWLLEHIGPQASRGISVKDFGAWGDGSHDDTAAIQAALDYIRVVGGSLFFPTGNYLISATLNFGNPAGAGQTIHIYGEHSQDLGSKLTWTGPDGGCMLRLQNATFSSIDHILFHGTITSGTFGGAARTGAGVCVWWSVPDAGGGATDEFLMHRCVFETAGGIGSGPSNRRTVTGTVSSGGLIQLGLNNTTGLAAGAVIRVTGVTGTTEANRDWIVHTVVGNNITLQGSTWANAWTGGGIVEGACADVLCGSGDTNDVSQGKFTECIFTGPLDSGNNPQVEYCVMLDGPSGNTKDFTFENCNFQQFLYANSFINCNGFAKFSFPTGGTQAAGVGGASVDGGQIACWYVVSIQQLMLDTVEMEGGCRLLYVVNPGNNSQQIVVDGVEWGGHCTDHSSLASGATQDVAIYCGGPQLQMRGVELSNDRAATPITATGCTGAGVLPIVVQVGSTSGLSIGNEVTVSFPNGNTAANGSWAITHLDATHITIDTLGTAGNGNFSSNGTVTLNPPPNIRFGGNVGAFSSVQCSYNRTKILPLQDINGNPYSSNTFRQSGISVESRGDLVQGATWYTLLPTIQNEPLLAGYQSVLQSNQDQAFAVCDTPGTIIGAVAKYELDWSLFQALASGTASIQLGDLPAKSSVQAIVCDTTVAWSQIAATNTLLEVGDNTLANGYILSHSVSSVVRKGDVVDAAVLGANLMPPVSVVSGTTVLVPGGSTIGFVPSWTATGALKVALSNAGGNLSGLTQGHTNIYVFLAVIP